MRIYFLNTKCVYNLIVPLKNMATYFQKVNKGIITNNIIVFLGDLSSKTCSKVNFYSGLK